MVVATGQALVVAEAAIQVVRANLAALAGLFVEEEVDTADPEPEKVAHDDPAICGHPDRYLIQATAGMGNTQTFCNACGGEVT